MPELIFLASRAVKLGEAIQVILDIVNALPRARTNRNRHRSGRPYLG